MNSNLSHLVDLNHLLAMNLWPALYNKLES